MSTQTIDYVTIIEPVLEVTLFGIADAAIWQEELAAEGLPTAYLSDGAHIILSAVDSKFKGIRFQEFSISVEIAQNEYFLAHAYNSIALFAFAERSFFQTPYYKGDIMVQPYHVTLRHRQSVLVDAYLPENAPLKVSAEEHERLQIHLPKCLRKNVAQPHCFYAQLEGRTNLYNTHDAKLAIASDNSQRYIKLLAASNFCIQDWSVRPTAKHGKSKTYHQLN